MKISVAIVILLLICLGITTAANASWERGWYSDTDPDDWANIVYDSGAETIEISATNMSWVPLDTYTWQGWDYEAPDPAHAPYVIEIYWAGGFNKAYNWPETTSNVIIFDEYSGQLQQSGTLGAPVSEPAPEPATMVMFGLAGAGMIVKRFRRKS